MQVWTRVALLTRPIVGSSQSRDGREQTARQETQGMACLSGDRWLGGIKSCSVWWIGGIGLKWRVSAGLMLDPITPLNHPPAEDVAALDSSCLAAFLRSFAVFVPTHVVVDPRREVLRLQRRPRTYVRTHAMDTLSYAG